MNTYSIQISVMLQFQSPLFVILHVWLAILWVQLFYHLGLISTHSTHLWDTTMPYFSPSPTYVLCGSPCPLAQMLTVLSYQVIPWPYRLFMISSPLTSKRAKSINEYTLKILVLKQLIFMIWIIIYVLCLYLPTKSNHTWVSLLA